MKKQEEKNKNNRPLLIFICVFVSIVVALGGALGATLAVKNARAVVKYGNATMDDCVVKYFASYYKMLYMRDLRMNGVKAYDTDDFWSSENEEGISYGELYRRGLEDYLRTLVASAGVFLEYSSYKPEDKLRVSRVADDILAAKAKGSVAEFNSLTEKYGFNYSDFCDAIALLYKAEQAITAIYGQGGLNLKNFPGECKKYLDTYSHISLIFVRTEQTFELDAEGNKIFDESNNAVMRDLTEEEKLERQKIIDTLTAAIEAKKNGGDLQITPEMFEIYLEKSDGDPDMYQKGYYFHKNAEATTKSAEIFPEVVERALSMEKYEYAKVDCSIGVCFIYKYDVVDGAYDDADNSFFSDFYSDASGYLYNQVLETLKPDVRLSPSFSEIDTLPIPYLEEFYVRSWN